MKISLAEIEEQLQSFVEGSLPIFSWGHRKDQIAPLLMGALRSSLIQDDQGELLAPSLLTIFVHPRARLIGKTTRLAWMLLPGFFKVPARRQEFVSFSRPLCGWPPVMTWPKTMCGLIPPSQQKRYFHKQLQLKHLWQMKRSIHLIPLTHF